jgi:hypothetical protein
MKSPITQVLQVLNVNYKRNLNTMTALSNSDSCVVVIQTAWHPVCIMLPNIRKQFHCFRKVIVAFTNKAC